MIPIVTIEGSTASGKSRLAMLLAQRMETEIISADSRQIYKFMDIGTAKPTKEDIRLVKHHIIDIINPDVRYNAGDFAIDAGEAINKIHENKRVPIIVGGTGFYIKTLLEGIFKSPDIPLELRARLEHDAEVLGLDAMHEKLMQIDPDAGRNIYKQDKHRILRALEIFEHTGKPISVHWQEQQIVEKYKPYKILLSDERELIYSRINKRFDEMIAEGLLIEIEALLQMGYSKDDYGLTAVGYREFMPHFYEKAELDECIEKAKQNTRRYAKRQQTWYRRQDFNLILNPKDIDSELIENLFNQINNS